MKNNFEEPVYEVVRFSNNVIATSGCGCFIGGIDLGGCDDDTCTGANVECSCGKDVDQNCV